MKCDYLCRYAMMNDRPETALRWLEEAVVQAAVDRSNNVTSVKTSQIEQAIKQVCSIGVMFSNDIYKSVFRGRSVSVHAIICESLYHFVTYMSSLSSCAKS